MSDLVWRIGRKIAIWLNPAVRPHLLNSASQAGFHTRTAQNLFFAICFCHNFTGPNKYQVKMMCGRDEKVGWTILVASNDELLHKLVAQVVNNNESRIIAATSVKAFFEKLIEGEVDLIIYDPDLHPMDTMSAFSIAKDYHPNIPSILIYGNEDYAVTKSILDKGVIFRMLKPMNKDDLKQICDGIRRSKTREAFDSFLESPIT